MTDKIKKPYRVFVTRSYIAVEFFDVMAETPRRAKTLARKAAKKLAPDPRAIACDNGWISEEPTLLDELGSSSVGINSLVEIVPDAFYFDADKS